MKSKNFDYSMKIKVEFNEPKECEAIYKSINIEKHKFERSKASINIKNNTLSINILAKDPKALKASFNTYLKLISVLHKVWMLKI